VREYDLTEAATINDDRLLGDIMRWDHERGYGFVRSLSNPDLRNAFLHATALVSKDDIESLAPGVRVYFDVIDSARGPRAINVELDQ
jgi:cold shock CspA family protein